MSEPAITPGAERLVVHARDVAQYARVFYGVIVAVREQVRRLQVPRAQPPPGTTRPRSAFIPCRMMRRRFHRPCPVRPWWDDTNGCRRPFDLDQESGAGIGL